MNDQVFKFVQHDRQVTIAPSARKFVADHYVSAYTCAEEAALKDKANQPQFHAGIVVAKLPTNCQPHTFTKSDIYGMADALDAQGDTEAATNARKIVTDREESERRGAELLERIKARKSSQPPAPVCAPASAEAEWPKYFVDKDSVMMFRSATAGDGMYFGRASDGLSCLLSPHWWSKGPARFGANVGYKPIIPTEAAKWLRENGHEAEAAKLLGAGDDSPYEPVGTVPVVGDRVAHVHSSGHDDAPPDHVRAKVVGLTDDDDAIPCCFAGGVFWELRDFKSGDFRVLKRRSAPDAGKVVGRG